MSPRASLTCENATGRSMIANCLVHVDAAIPNPRNKQSNQVFVLMHICFHVEDDIMTILFHHQSQSSLVPTSQPKWRQQQRNLARSCGLCGEKQATDDLKESNIQFSNDSSFLILRMPNTFNTQHHGRSSCREAIKRLLGMENLFQLLQTGSGLTQAILNSHDSFGIQMAPTCFTFRSPVHVLRNLRFCCAILQHIMMFIPSCFNYASRSPHRGAPSTQVSTTIASTRTKTPQNTRQKLLLNTA